MPFPTARLSSVAHRALAVDRELSPLVRRRFSVSTVAATASNSDAGPGTASTDDDPAAEGAHPDAGAQAQAQALAHDMLDPGACVLRVHYRATTNRMLRVALNSFMDSLALVLEVMEKLDADVLEAQLRGA